MASGSSTVVEHLPNHPKVKGSRPVTAIGTGEREKWQKIFIKKAVLDCQWKALYVNIFSHSGSVRGWT
jgi:hypothetical protein